MNGLSAKTKILSHVGPQIGSRPQRADAHLRRVAAARNQEMRRQGQPAKASRPPAMAAAPPAPA